jgi:hypothetical protein
MADFIPDRRRTIVPDKQIHTDWFSAKLKLRGEF